MNTTVDSRGQTELHYESTSRAIIRCKGKLCKRSGTREFTIFTTMREFNGRPSSVQAVSIEGGPKRALRDQYELLRLLYTECPNGTEERP